MYGMHEMIQRAKQRCTLQSNEKMVYAIEALDFRSLSARFFFVRSGLEEERRHAHVHCRAIKKIVFFFLRKLLSSASLLSSSLPSSEKLSSAKAPCFEVPGYKCGTTSLRSYLHIKLALKTRRCLHLM